MASTPRGSHRRVRFSAARSTSAMIGFAVVSAAGVGALAAPALASAPAAKPAQHKTEVVKTALTSLHDCSLKLRNGIHAQAGAQKKAADESRRKAEAARKAKEARAKEARAKAEAARKARAAAAARRAKAKAERERASRSAARAPLNAAPGAGSAPAHATGWVTPLANVVIGTPYHRAGSMWSSGYHTGVDFVTPTGTPLRAVGPGTVVSAGNGGAYGNQVVIRHADGIYTQYAHLSSIAVSAGQAVTGGQQIGLSGATGNVTGPHLHFEARTTPDYGSDIDPLAYLRGHGVSI